MSTAFVRTGQNARWPTWSSIVQMTRQKSSNLQKNITKNSKPNLVLKMKSTPNQSSASPAGKWVTSQTPAARQCVFPHHGSSSAGSAKRSTQFWRKENSQIVNTNMLNDNLSIKQTHHSHISQQSTRASRALHSCRSGRKSPAQFLLLPSASGSNPPPTLHPARSPPKLPSSALHPKWSTLAWPSSRHRGLNTHSAGAPNSQTFWKTWACEHHSKLRM